MLAAAIFIAAPTLLQGPTEPHWTDWWTENLRWSIDESVRVLTDGKGKSTATLAFFGLDIHKVISTDERDVATLNLQPFLTRVDSLDPHPPLFDGSEDWELVWRIFNANVKLRDDGSMNLRVGHFEVPFGLEHLVVTNGTLRDYTHPANFGLKADWGATLNGELESFEYEVAWSRGSGNEWDSEGDPGVFSGRFGTPRDSDQVFGVSFVEGDFQTPAGILERSRVGLDATVYRKNLGFMAEVSSGENGGDTDVLKALGEVNWRNSNETQFSWVQLVSSSLDGPSGETTTLESKLGMRWTVATGWNISVQYTQILDPAMPGGSHDGGFALQLRVRF
ncbi:MAG: hypothetical protein ACI8QC_003644 [Planctomycetota bacterium]|jgi:hypothetical protein